MPVLVVDSCRHWPASYRENPGVLLARGLRLMPRLARHKPYRALGSIFTGGALLALSAIVLLLGLDIQTFSRLTYERPVATIQLHQVGDKQFDATLTLADVVIRRRRASPRLAPPIRRRRRRPMR